MAEDNRAKRWRELRLGLLTLFATVALLFLVLELAARTLSWQMGKGFWTRPNTFTSAFFVTYDWPPPLLAGDAGTFRAGQTVPRRKPAGELRVICLGGSTTVNLRNAEGLTYSLETQKALAGKLPGYEVKVLNAGSDAFSTAHSLVNFSLRLLDFGPDLITVYHNVNDLTALEFGRHLAPDYSNKYLDDAFLAYEHRGGLGGTILRTSRALQMLKWKLTVLKKALEKSSRGGKRLSPERGRRIFRRNLDSFVAVARQHGIAILLLTQARRDGERSDFARYNDEIRRAWPRHGLRPVDISGALSGKSDYFVDEVHLSSAGVRALASVLAPAIEGELQALLAERQSGLLPESPD